MPDTPHSFTVGNGTHAGQADRDGRSEKPEGVLHEGHLNEIKKTAINH
jgi:hypothetical protein